MSKRPIDMLHEESERLFEAYLRNVKAETEWHGRRMGMGLFRQIVSRNLEAFTAQQNVAVEAFIRSVADQGASVEFSDIWSWCHEQHRNIDHMKTEILLLQIKSDLGWSSPPDAAQVGQLDVPSAGETVLSYLCTPDRLEAVLGDFEQGFRRRAAEHGERAARRWYYWQTARAVVAFGFQAALRMVALRELLGKLGL